MLRQRTAIQRDARAEIIRQLRSTMDQVKAVLAGAPSDYQLWSLPQLQRSMELALSEMDQAISSALGSAASRSWEAGQELVDGPIEAGGIRISAVLPEIDIRQLQAMRTFMTGRIRDISTTIANRINAQLGLVIIGAQSPSDAVAAIKDLLETGGRSRAITITRTELGRAFSTAANERMVAAAEHLPGLRKQWRRSGKIHSRLHHDSIDGQIQPMDEPFVLGNGVRIMYPRDPAAPAAETINCGCESLDYMENWDVTNPGKMPFTDQELALSATKRALEQAA